MIIQLFVYFGVLFLLFYLLCYRERYFLYPIDLFLRLFKQLNKRFGDSFGVHSGNQLLLELSELLHHQNGARKWGTVSLPRYKFYTDLILELLRGVREFGGGGVEVLNSFKKTIGKELQFDRRLKGLFFGALAQFMAISIITWGFAFLTNKVADIRISPVLSSFILLLQLLGAFCFSFLFFRLQKREFGPFEEMIRLLCTLRALSGAGLSVQRTLERVTLDRLPQSGELYPIATRLERTIFSYSQLGVPMKEDLNLILDDLWAGLDHKQIRFGNFLAMLKFLVAALFYFSAYLIYLLSLFSQFLN